MDAECARPCNAHGAEAGSSALHFTLQDDLTAPSNIGALFVEGSGDRFVVSKSFDSTHRHTPICGRIPTSPLLRFAISGRLSVPLEPAAPLPATPDSANPAPLRPSLREA